MTKQTLELTLKVREDNIPAIADNGTKQLIEKILKRYRGRAICITKTKRNFSKKMKRNLRYKDYPQKLRIRAVKLTNKKLV